MGGTGMGGTGMGGTGMGGTGMGGTGTALSHRWSRGPVPRSPWGQKMLGCAGHRGPKGLKQASGGTFHRALLTLARHLVQFRVNFVPLRFPKSSRRIFGHSAPPRCPLGARHANKRPLAGTSQPVALDARQEERRPCLEP